MDNIMWIARDKEDGRLWIHPYSKPVLHEYIDYEGNKHERWVTESQIEIDSELFKEITFENSPKELISKDLAEEYGSECYNIGYSDAVRFEYGGIEEGNITFNEYIEARNSLELVRKDEH